MHITSNVIDDLSRNSPLATIGTQWQVVTDQVMGGMSSGTLVREIIGGRPAIHMCGNVSLENNGGFVQIGLDLAPDGKAIDASSWTGIELDVLGNGEEYNLHLRSLDLTRPWQSYRHGFRAVTSWQTVRLPFGSFIAHRTDAPLDLSRLRRVGLVAIGRAFSADLALGGIRFFTRARNCQLLKDPATLSPVGDLLGKGDGTDGYRICSVDAQKLKTDLQCRFPYRRKTDMSERLQSARS